MLRALVFAALLVPGLAGAARKPKVIPDVVLGTSRVVDEPTRSADPIASQITKRHVATIERCYAKRLATKPDATGALVVRLAVTTTGKTAAVTARSFDTKLDTCVVAAVKKWRFAAERTDTTVELVFDLDALDDSPLGRQMREAQAAADLVFDGAPPEGESLTAPRRAGAALGKPNAAVTTDDTLTPELVSSRVQSTFLAGLRRCYNRADPSESSGGLAVSFTVRGDGSTADAAVNGANGVLAACMKSRIASWHFPPPSDGKATARFMVPLTM